VDIGSERRKMRHEINAALKQHLSEKFGAIEHWVEDKAGFQYRLVFEMEAIEGREKRAIRYVDIIVVEGCVLAFTQNRKSMRVEYAAPGSIEILEKFIQENCTKRRS
jgi:hypothetical protein